MNTSTSTESLLQARLKDREGIAAAAQRIDAFRRKYGKPPKGFDTVALLRKLRRTR